MRKLRIAGLVLLAACGGSIPEPTAVRGPAVMQPSFAFPDLPAMAAAPPEPPLGLTASDGTGLRLVSLGARAIVEDPLSFTELHLVFDNPEDRRLEGTFSITLPEGAAISRFAMKLDDGWQEGEVVEKKAAREAYEDFLHRRQDPALLEQAAGNQFSARVFPIPPRGRKEIIVSYSQEIIGEKSWSIPLRGLPELGSLDVAVTLAGQSQPIATLSRSHFTPDRDFGLDARFVAKSAGLRSGNLVAARVRPMPDAAPDPLGPTILLVDTSASRALGFVEQTRLVDALVRRIAARDARTPIAVVAFDQTTSSIFEGEAGAWGAAEQKRLRSRQAFGASDLGRAIDWAEAHADARSYKRVVLVGDGVATAGETSPAALAARVAKLAQKGVERLDAVAVGGIRDDAALRKLVTAGLPRDGVVADAASGSEAIDRRLTMLTRSNVAVQIEGARWSYPSHLDGVQPGDEVLVYADVPEGQPVRVRVGDRKSAALDLVEVARPLLERSFAKAKIASLLAVQGPDASPSIVREVVALSTKHRVLSPYTSLLVLETDQDYARFSLDRKALADILRVDGGKLAVADRRPPKPAPADNVRLADRRHGERLGPHRGPARLRPPPPAPPTQPSEPAPSAAPVANAVPKLAKARVSGRAEPLAARGSMWGASVGESFGAGGLGLTGVGTGGGGRGEGIGLGSVGTVGRGAGTGQGQGFGSGHGRMAGAHRAAVPQIRQGATQVSGRIPPEVIRRIVRQNFGRFRRCYEESLRTSPNLSGRVAVRFVIGRDGSVSSATSTGSDVADRRLAECVARSFYELKFPAPEGGIVTVTYPIAFAPAERPNQSAVVMPRAEVPVPPPPPPPPPQKTSRIEPYTGRFKTVMDTIEAGGAKAAVQSAFEWHRESPGDVMALVALGEALEASKEPASAARVYGSIVDLFPARADLRRFAGARLSRVGAAGALDLASDTFAKAAEERPDHPSSHRALAFALLKKGDHAGAFAAAARGLEQRYPSNRFRGVTQILREDLGLIAASWIRFDPSHKDDILGRLARAGGSVEDAPSLRFVLTWETDANDVDFHIEDALGSHAYYQQPELASGGRLYADVTTGYGPECFTIRLARAQRSASYKLSAHYYARGPMGYGMGNLQIIDHDGQGHLTFEERPFVVMADRAFVDLGRVFR
jgi:tetratricopeptide (TPR) repeat protein